MRRSRPAEHEPETRAAALPLVAIASPLLVFLLLALELERHGPGPLWWEAGLQHWLVAHWQDGVMLTAAKVSHYAGGWKGLLLLAAGVAILAIASGRPRDAALAALSVAAICLTPVLKEAFRRAPPPHLRAEQYSFPSGHAIGTMALAAALVLIAWHGPFRVPAILLSVSYTGAVGAAVVAAQGHWPSDVLAGWAIALAWVAAVYTILLRVRSASVGGSPRPN